MRIALTFSISCFFHVVHILGMVDPGVFPYSFDKIEAVNIGISTTEMVLIDLNCLI